MLVRNKKQDEYNRFHGGKWSIQNLRLYLEGTRGKKITDKLFDDIHWLLVHSLLAVAATIVNDRHCFDCYGYDIIIDNNLKPWLIEANASPSLSATTPNDRIMKYKLVHDVIGIVCPNGQMPNVRHSRQTNEENMGNFDVLYDEEQATSIENVSEVSGSNGTKRRQLSPTRRSSMRSIPKWK